IAQRWNDVLAVKNSDYNGGYEFVAYQWFLNGMPLEGFTTSQYYTGANLDFSGDYQVLLTRKDDGVSVFTCSVVPVEFSQGELENTGVVVFANDVINVEIQKAAKCYVYSMSGLLYSVSDLAEGVNIIDMPKEAGIYIMQFNYLDGDVEIRKIVVGKI
ncbi:MAG: T9SS type A sorting domain-containing protein, partial [Paludibacteraceae bacterium]|nr:T9SS type A sorting domain-containing protein [Paludibacteraceae bacterium]